MKQILRLLILGIFLALLAGCSHFYSVNPKPSKYEQCKALRTQLLYLQGKAADKAPWQISSERVQITRQMTDLRCAQVIYQQKTAKRKTEKAS